MTLPANERALAALRTLAPTAQLDAALRRLAGERVPPLADLIRARAAELHLGESWDTT